MAFARSRMPKKKGGRVDIKAYYIKRRDELRRELASFEERLARVPAEARKEAGNG